MDDFDKVVKNINDIHNAIVNKEFELALFISFVRCRINQYETEIMKELFSPCVDDIVFYDMHTQSGTNLAANDLMLEGTKRVECQQWPCDMLFNRIHVTSEGYMDACCTDFDHMTAVEDLREMGLLEAWDGKRMRKLRRDHLNKEQTKTHCFNCINNVIRNDEEPLNEKLYLRNMRL